MTNVYTSTRAMEVRDDSTAQGSLSRTYAERGLLVPADFSYQMRPKHSSNTPRKKERTFVNGVAASQPHTSEIAHTAATTAHTSLQRSPGRKQGLSPSREQSTAGKHSFFWDLSKLKKVVESSEGFPTKRKLHIS